LRTGALCEDAARARVSGRRRVRGKDCVHSSGEFVPLRILRSITDLSAILPSLNCKHRGKRLESRSHFIHGRSHVEVRALIEHPMPRVWFRENCRDPEDESWLVLSLSVLRSHLALRWRQAAGG
jgi:hypothetical protein